MLIHRLSDFRYVLISCHANYGRIYSQTNIFLMIAFAWTFSFGILVPPLAEVWGTFGLKEKTFSCTILRRVHYTILQSRVNNDAVRY